jgi:hypothetical protein
MQSLLSALPDAPYQNVIFYVLTITEYLRPAIVKRETANVKGFPNFEARDLSVNRQSAIGKKAIAREARITR